MYRLCRLSIVALITFVAALAVSPTQAKASPPASLFQLAPLTMESLLHSDQPTLEALYRNAGMGSVPYGSFDGRAIPSPGTRKGIRQSKLIGLLWKGKEFPGDESMINRVAFGKTAVRADMYFGESWLDGQPSIILDYANTSRLFGNARDEMREISPGLYLGLTYVRKCTGPKLSMYYTVQALPGCSNDRVRNCQ